MRIWARIERRTATVCLCRTANWEREREREREREKYTVAVHTTLPGCPLRLYQRRPLCPLGSGSRRTVLRLPASFIHRSFACYPACLNACLLASFRASTLALAAGLSGFFLFLSLSPSFWILHCTLCSYSYCSILLAQCVLLHLGRTLINSAAIDISSAEWLIRPMQP